MTDIALIGCGRVVVEAYVDALRAIDWLRPLVVCDLSEQRARDIAEVLSRSGVRAVATVDPAHPLIEQADLLLLAVPPDAGLDLIRQALARGQSVLAEKPLTADVATLDELDHLARSSGAWLGIVTNYLHRPDLNAAIVAVRQDHIGVPIWARLHTVSDGHWTGTPGYKPDWRIQPPQAPTGVAADKGYHLLYLAEAICDAPIVECQWHATSVRGAAVDTWMAQTSHASGATCSLAASWAPRGQARDMLEVHGTGGSLYIDPMMAAPLRVVSNDGGTTEIPYPREDLWGYRGTFLAAARQVASHQPAELSGPHRWASIIDAVRTATPPAAGTLTLGRATW